MPTPEQLLAKATRYLASYTASRVRLRTILQRYAAKFNQSEDQDPDPGLAERIETVLDRCEALGWLDDRRFATARARRLLGRGHPPRIVQGKLAGLGIAAAVGREAVEDLRREEGDVELSAALRLAKRRGLGPFARMPLDDDGRRRQLAVLARAGFSGAVARKIVDARSEAELVPDGPLTEDRGSDG